MVGRVPTREPFAFKSYEIDVVLAIHRIENRVFHSLANSDDSRK